MEKFNAFVERTLVPIAAKIAAQRHLAAVKDGMIMAIPLSILGGVCLIMSTPPFTLDTLPEWGIISDVLAGWYNFAQANGDAMKMPFRMTMGLMGMFISMSVAFHLAKTYKLSQLNCSMVSVATFLLVAAPVTSATAAANLVEGVAATDLLSKLSNFIPMQYLDASGIFTAIVVALGTVEITNFILKKNIRFKMPDGVPPNITSSFDAIIPLFASVAVFYSISLFTQSAFAGKIIPSVIMTLLAPAVSGLDSIIGISFITIIAQVLWFFGLHGASITQAVRLPFMSVYLINNIDAYSAGQPLAHFFTQPFWNYCITLGGSGATLGLCILLVKSKSAQLKSLGKLSIGPAIFNINEPIIFGLPLVLNPLMMVPFIFVPVVNAIIAYSCMAVGFVGKGVLETPWTTPAPLGAALGCMDIKAGIMVVGLILLDIVLYYPFFKAMEKQKLAEEEAAA